jgi:hemin uptake protein HemP
MAEQYRKNRDIRDTPAESQGIPVVESSHLFGRFREILIHHAGAVYRLRITKNDKLIMNK